MEWPVIISAYSEVSALLWRLEDEHKRTTVRLRPRQGHRGSGSQAKLTIQGEKIEALFAQLYRISVEEDVFDVGCLRPPLIWRQRLEECVEGASGLLRSDFSLQTLPQRHQFFPDEDSWSSEDEPDRGHRGDAHAGGQTPHAVRRRRQRGGGQTPHLAADERRPDNCPAAGYVGRALEMPNAYRTAPGAAPDLGWFGESMSTF